MKKNTVLIVFGLAIFVGGFLTGQEYNKIQLRNKIQELDNQLNSNITSQSENNIVEQQKENELKKMEPLKLTGVGQQATELFKLQTGLNRFNLTNSGTGHFSVWLVDDKGNNIELLANDSGQPFAGSKAVQITQTGNYLLNIEADSSSDWSVTVE